MISFTFTPLGSSRVSKEAKIFKELEFLGLDRCLSAKLEQAWKNHPKMAVFGWILDVFEDSSILTEKQRLKPKNSNSLKFFASFDTLLDPRGAKVRNEMIREANTPVCKANTRPKVSFRARLCEILQESARFCRNMQDSATGPMEGIKFWEGQH